ncbi:malonyl-CoA synthase [Pandoraea terrae]|uniref:Malonyl-CoA synthase n=1 Tax=Pandoraea terrae TaxID=1537710 RepID=A0A5E4RKA1_9BURK|nr:malonyl-CoA synthase [Pandoraea terrae]VVD62449.1 malonyl-CoA synthase [Pandoraea terrae]
MSDANLYTQFAARFPADMSACAIETPDGLYYSWDDMEHASARLAHLLASLDLPQGARVAVQVEKSPEALLLYLATLRAGLVYLPLNTAYREAEIAYFVENAEPSVVVCSPANFGWVSKVAFKANVGHVFTLGDDRTGSLLERAAYHSDTFATVPRAPEDLAAILYTSGTTGRSKGAMLSHGNLASNARVLHEFWGWADRPAGSDVLLHALPIFHVHGLFVASHAALLSGSKMIWLPKFDAQQVLRHLPRSTVFMGVPTYYVRLLAEAGLDRQACEQIRLFVSGSAPLLRETFEAFRERTAHTILERYGMSETVMLVSNPYRGEAAQVRRAGTVGVPLPGVFVRIVDDAGVASGQGEIGHIQVRGPNVFAGYWRMPEKTADEFTEDGYFKTGDVGKFDDDGYLHIVGRSKDLIISGGFNVYPKEIEGFIDEMTGVAESAVIGVPHPDFGEAVVAVIVPRGGAVPDEAAVIGALKQKIANFKVPKRVHFVSELPRNAMGKVQKNLLRERFAVM